jgi:hypothetical protein
VSTTYRVCEHVLLNVGFHEDTGSVDGVVLHDAEGTAVKVWGCGECDSPWFVCQECEKVAGYSDLYDLEDDDE